MSKVRRTQIYLPEEQILLLRERAAASHGSVSGEIREAIEQYLATSTTGSAYGIDPIDGLIGKIDSTPPDLSARVDDYLYGRPGPTRRRRAAKGKR